MHFRIPAAPVAGAPRLRRSQVETLHRIAAGWSAKEIADEYRVRENAVTDAVMRIRRHFDARNSVDMVAQALVLGLIDLAELARLRRRRPARGEK
jgi:DNA-binding CsgD family transcriptional regulator